MSEFFELCKAKYDAGKWTRAMLRALVAGGRLTAEEFETITGEAYA